MRYFNIVTEQQACVNMQVGDSEDITIIRRGDDPLHTNVSIGVFNCTIQGIQVANKFDGDKIIHVTRRGDQLKYFGPGHGQEDIIQPGNVIRLGGIIFEFFC